MIDKDMLLKIHNVTKIPLDTLMRVCGGKGIRYIFEHPDSLKCTKAQKQKLKDIRAIIQMFEESVFLNETIELDSSEKAGEYFVKRLRLEKQKEYFEVALLNTRNKVIDTVRLFEGTLNEAPLYPREIVRLVLDHDAHSIVIAHNHPSDSREPSRSDIDATNKIKKALEIVGVKVLDHIIVAGDGYTSMAERGLIT